MISSCSSITPTTTCLYIIKHRHVKQICKLMALSLLVCLQIGSYRIAAQCPWTRESVELHADCICDFNPSHTSSFSDEQQSLVEQRPVNRMSVQCAPVEFNQLIRALKQTASVELPNELLNINANGLQTTTPNNEQLRFTSGTQLASQAKLDLLHVSNSSVKQLNDDTFILDTQNSPQLNNSVAHRIFESRHLVVAIQSLHLSRCGIEQISAGAFNGLEWSLTSLSLSDNQLEFIPVEAINKLFNLKVLDISNNRLIHLAANSFAKLCKLNALRLADNRIGAVYVSSNVSQPAISSEAFTGLENSLTDLNLKNTQLDAFPVAIKRLHNLAFLNLAQNQISHIPPNSFANMSSLTAINLERNRISTIDDGTFAGVESSLSSLSLLGNLLEVYPTSQLGKLRVIRRLDMGFNGIEMLPDGAFVTNQRLILVALDGNPLETLPESAFKPLEGTLRGLSIGGKALNCDCRMSWMLRWQQEFSLQISSRERLPQFCAKPHYLRSLVSFAALKPEHLTCNEPVQITNTSPYVIQARNFTGWTLGTNIEQATTALANATHSTFAYTEGPHGSTVDYANRRHLSVAPTVWSILAPAIYSISPRISASTVPTTTLVPESRSGAFSVATTTTFAPTTTMAHLSSVTISEITTTAKPPDVTTPAFNDNDLTEAGTDDELTARSDYFDDNATTTEIMREQQTHTTYPSTYRELVPVYTQSSLLDQHGRLFGERNPTVTTNGLISTEAEMRSPMIVSSRQHGNSLGSLPDDELFASDPNNRKLNRHGYSWPTQRTRPQGNMVAGGELMRQNATQSDYVNNRVILSSVIADFISRNNRTQSSIKQGTANNSTTAKPSVRPSTGTEPKKQARPIHSVFGNRSATDNQKHRGSSNATDPIAPGNKFQPAHSYSNDNQVVPAVPTTINVYKASPKYNQTAVSSLYKHSRIVDDNLMPQATQPDWSKPSFTSTTAMTTTSTSASSSAPTTMQSLFVSTRQPTIHQWPTTRTDNSHHLIESDIERYTVAASGVQPRISIVTTSTSSSSSSSSSPARPKITIPARTDLTRLQSEATLASSTSTTETPHLAPTTLNHRGTPHNNTRMSVFSMYRLASESMKNTANSDAALTSEPSIGHDSSSVVYSQPVSTLRTYSPSTGTIATTTMMSSSKPLQTKPDTTTRMATTIRIVDSMPRTKTQPASTTSTSSPPLLSTPSTSTILTTSILPTSTTTTSTTTTTTTATPRPVMIAHADILRKHHSDWGQTPASDSPTNLISFANSSYSMVPTRNALNEQQQLSEVSRESHPEGHILQTIANTGTAKRQPVDHHIALQTAPTSASTSDEQQEPPTAATSVPKRTTVHPSPKSTNYIPTVSMTGGPINSHQPSLITKDTIVHNRRQSRDESLSTSDTNGTYHPARFIGRIIRLDNFDQMAIILAGLLCIFILVLALITTFVCFSSSRAQADSNKQDNSRLASFSSSESNLRQRDDKPYKTSSKKLAQTTTLSGNCVTRLLCCCFLSNANSSRRVTPIRSLIMQDDDNSSGNSSNGIKSNGKSMLLAAASSSKSSGEHNQDMLFESIREASIRVAHGKKMQQVRKNNTLSSRRANNRTKSYAFDNGALDLGERNGEALRPLDHEASIQCHRQAHAMDQEYFLGVASRTLGRRQLQQQQLHCKQQLGIVNSSFATEPSLLSSKRKDDDTGEWIRDTPSSCDSDKSFSPGANKNNHYNIGDAHRAYLKSDSAAHQVRASRFVTTSSHQGSKSGLLKTIDAVENQKPPDGHPQQQIEYFDNMSRMSSDKSTTDDSRAPLSSSTRRQNYMRAVIAGPQSTSRSTVKSFRGPVARSRSIGRLPEFHLIDPTTSLAGIAGDLCTDYVSADLVPMSAEEEWPEPYVDPADVDSAMPSQLAGSNSINNGNDRQYLRQQHQHYRASDAESNNQRSQNVMTEYQSNNSTTRMKLHKRSNSSSHGTYDNSYLANWHTVSRNQQQLIHQPSVSLAIVGRNQPSLAPNSSALVRYRSNPSLDGNHIATGLIAAGGANWLRWTPCEARPGRHSEGSTTGKSHIHSTGKGGWHQDNQVDAMYVAPASQQR